jgi:hypothetical protein
MGPVKTTDPAHEKFPATERLTESVVSVKMTCPANVVVLATDKFPEIAALAPILTFFAIANPPATIRAPVTVLDEFVVLVMFKVDAVIVLENAAAAEKLAIPETFN